MSFRLRVGVRVGRHGALCVRCIEIGLVSANYETLGVATADTGCACVDADSDDDDDLSFGFLFMKYSGIMPMMQPTVMPNARPCARWMEDGD